MAKKKTGTPLSVEGWPLWKLFGLFLLSNGLFSAMLTFTPSYHPQALILGVILTTIGLVASLYAVRRRNWWAGIVSFNIWPLQLFSIGVRSLINDFSRGWIWIVPLMACYILAWLIPYLNPKLSAYLRVEAKRLREVQYKGDGRGIDGIEKFQPDC